jgi:hypothetical protein
MASKQGSAARPAPKGQTGRAPKSSPPSGSARSPRSGSGERDENYDLISVLYHALQGADTVGQYLADAQGDEELREFLEETRAEYAARAAAAKELLASRLSDMASDEEDEDEEDEEGEED